MKMFKKLMAVVLTGALAVSMLTGCALGDAVKASNLRQALSDYATAETKATVTVKKDTDFDDAAEKAVSKVEYVADVENVAVADGYVYYIETVKKTTKSQNDFSKNNIKNIYDGLADKGVEFEGDVKTGIEFFDAKASVTDSTKTYYVIVVAKAN